MDDIGQQNKLSETENENSSIVNENEHRLVVQEPVGHNVNLENHDEDFEDNQKKNLDDIQALLNYGVDYKVICSVKGINMQELGRVIQEKQLKIPLPLTQGEANEPHMDLIPNLSQFVADLETPKDQGNDVVMERIQNDQARNQMTVAQTNSQIQQLTQLLNLNNNQQQLNGYLQNVQNTSNQLQKIPLSLNLNNILRNIQHQANPQPVIKKTRKKSWKESDFPNEHLGKYYCLDCNKAMEIRDCTCGRASWRWCEVHQKYLQPSYHECFVKKRRKIRKKWKDELFPTAREDGKSLNYYCADCMQHRDEPECKCARKCWRWCMVCGKFRQPSNHSHFTKEKRKKKKRWAAKDFPKQNLGKYYCLDCHKSNETRKCSCGRDGWRWCHSCGQYLSKSHHHFRKRKRDDSTNTNIHTSVTSAQTELLSNFTGKNKDVGMNSSPIYQNVSVNVNLPQHLSNDLNLLTQMPQISDAVQTLIPRHITNLNQSIQAMPLGDMQKNGTEGEVEDPIDVITVYQQNDLNQMEQINQLQQMSPLDLSHHIQSLQSEQNNEMHLTENETDEPERKKRKLSDSQ